MGTGCGGWAWGLGEGTGRSRAARREVYYEVLRAYFQHFGPLIEAEFVGTVRGDWAWGLGVRIRCGDWACEKAELVKPGACFAKGVELFNAK